MKSILKISNRIIALTILYFICFTVISGALLSVPAEQNTEAGSALLALVVISFINTAVLTYITLRSRWTGWKLILTIFILFYGVVTVMTQIETAVFITRLPPGLLSRLFLAGAIMAAVFSPLLVLILGKARSKAIEDGRSRLQMTTSEWAIKLTVIAIAYVVIYFSFGYFIAWRNPAVRSYYGGGNDPGSFLTQMARVLHDTPGIVLLQVVRGLMWTALAVPVIKMMKGARWEAGLAVALAFGVLMNTQLLLPNPLMPYEVRMAHLLETATSNFLFGWLVAIVLLAHSSFLGASASRRSKFFTAET